MKVSRIIGRHHAPIETLVPEHWLIKTGNFCRWTNGQVFDFYGPHVARLLCFAVTRVFAQSFLNYTKKLTRAIQYSMDDLYTVSVDSFVDKQAERWATDWFVLIFFSWSRSGQSVDIWQWHAKKNPTRPWACRVKSILMRRLEETGWTISTVFVQVCFPLVMPDMRFSDDLQK